MGASFWFPKSKLINCTKGVLRLRIARGLLHANADHGRDVRPNGPVAEEEGQVRGRTSRAGPVPEAGGEIRAETGQAVDHHGPARPLEDGGMHGSVRKASGRSSHDNDVLNTSKLSYFMTVERIKCYLFVEYVRYIDDTPSSFPIALKIGI